jgi:endoglucanase
VGGIDERVLVGKAVRVGKERVPGVIGAKPIHLQKPAERKKPFRRRDLFIDIGAADREKAREIVSVGDYVAFATAFGEFGTGRWKGKAFDDRVGCAILAELLADRYEFDLYGVFTVQEEVGLRGSGVAAFQLQPDIALVLEATTCADTPDNEQLCQVTKLGQGPAVTIRDNSVIADKGLVHMLEQTARRLSIPYQFRQGGAGGNDAGRIATTGPGVRVATLSVPTRYIHAPVSIIDQQDYHNTRKLAQGFLAALGGV